MTGVLAPVRQTLQGLLVIEPQGATLPGWLAVPLLALCLKPLFAWRMLRDLVAQVEAALGQGLQAGVAQSLFTSTPTL